MPDKKPKRQRVTKTGLCDRRAALLEIVRAAEKSERTLFKGLAGLVEQLAQRMAPDAGSAP